MHAHERDARTRLWVFNSQLRSKACQIIHYCPLFEASGFCHSFMRRAFARAVSFSPKSSAELPIFPLPNSVVAARIPCAVLTS